jgi:hypothetical protein
MARRLALLKKFAPTALLDRGIRKANQLSAHPKPTLSASPKADLVHANDKKGQ